MDYPPKQNSLWWVLQPEYVVYKFDWGKAHAVNEAIALESWQTNIKIVTTFRIIGVIYSNGR